MLIKSNKRVPLFQLPLETPIFWLQHSLMIVIPICMIHMGGVYSLEAPSHMYWFTFSYGIVLLYHFVLLQGISMVSIIFPSLLSPVACTTEVLGNLRSKPKHKLKGMKGVKDIPTPGRLEMFNHSNPFSAVIISRGLHGIIRHH